MNWNMWLRQIHRWLSIAFTVAVIVNFIAVALGTHADWVGFLALPRSPCCCSPACTCSCCPMPPNGAAGDAPADRRHVKAGKTSRKPAKAARRSQRRPLPSGSPRSRSSSPAAIRRSRRRYGDAPVQAYIAAMPGWKSDVGRRLDALIVRTVPDVRKAVKWNSPLYGVEGQGWFLGLHCFTQYVKVAFFRGASLRPRAARPKQGQGHALPRHPRGRRTRRGAVRRLGEAGQPSCPARAEPRS